MDQGYHEAPSAAPPAGGPPARGPIPLFPAVELPGGAAQAELTALEPRLAAAQASLEARAAQGDTALSWLHYPTTADRDVFARVNEAAQQIRVNSEVLVVLGEEDYVLGAQAGMAAMASQQERVLFSTAFAEAQALLEEIADRPFSVLRVSLSDSEPDFGFAALYDQLKQRFGAEADRRVYVTAVEDSVLTRQGQDAGWTVLPLYQGLTAVDASLTPAGLLPMISAGANPVGIMMGSARMEVLLTQQEKTIKNPAWRYAAAKHLLKQKGLCPGTLRTNVPCLESMSAWYSVLTGPEAMQSSAEVLLTVSGAAAAGNARTAIRLTVPSEDAMELAGLFYFFRLAETLCELL